MTDPVAALQNKTASAPEAASQARSTELRSTRFRSVREQGWRTLDSLVGRIETDGISALSASEIQELPLLYRAAVSSLSVARTIVLDRNLLLYLENLCLRAYLAVYGPRTGMWHSFSGFVLRDFPRAVRAMRLHLAIALIVLLAGCIAGYVLVGGDMSFYTMIMPESLAGGRGPDSTREELYSSLFSPWPGFVESFIVFANSLFRHNTLVGIMCFGLGFALGVPTLALLLYNGLILGAFVSIYAAKGLTLECLGWLSIHGVTEILAVLLCAAAGLVVAEKIVFPGYRTRLESLSVHGRRAASVAGGAVLLFFVAGILEGGFREFVSNTTLRYTVAIVSAVLWFGYFTRVGRRGGNGTAD